MATKRSVVKRRQRNQKTAKTNARHGGARLEQQKTSHERVEHADPITWSCPTLSWHREGQASVGDALMSGFSGGHQDLAAGFLRHLAMCLSLFSDHFAEEHVKNVGGLSEDFVQRFLYSLSEQAHAVSELALRMQHEPARVPQVPEWARTEVTS